MKKTIEAELKKLAQKILEGDAEKQIDQLKQEAKILYEKLTILQFTYAHLEDKNTEEQPALETVSYAEDTYAPSKPQPSRTQSQTSYKEGNYYVPDGTEFNDSDAITEPNTEKIKDIVAQMPPETEGLDRLMDALNEDWSHLKTEQKQAKAPESNFQQPEPPQQDEPELLKDPEIPEEHFAEPPIFEPKQPEPEPEKKQLEQKTEITPQQEQTKEESKPIEHPEAPKPASNSNDDFRKIGVDYDNLPDFEPLNNRQSEQRPRSVNDRLKSGISIGLNDRLAYIKHLFAGNAADYNRVISQLNTFSDFDEAYKFIQLVVKPDYNNWEGKEQYEDRFVEIIANKFQ